MAKDSGNRTELKCSNIYIFIRINCSYKNNKLNKNKEKKIHTTCQGTQRIKCILTIAEAKDNINTENR